MRTMNCVECGKLFEYQTSKRKFCHENCKARDKRRRQRDRINERQRLKSKALSVQRRATADKKCIICGKPFIPVHSLNQKICSDACERIKSNNHASEWKKRNRDQYLAMARIRDKARSGSETRRRTHRESHHRNKVRRNAYKKYLRVLDSEKVKEYERKQYWKVRNDPEKYAIYKKKINDKYNERYNSDTGFQVRNRLKALVLHAFRKYSTEGKVKPSRKYDIDYQKIFEHLGACPGEIKDYEIDHVIPLSLFNFNRQEDVKEAFKPSNHQWLLASANQSKNNILPIAILFDDKLWS